MKLSALETVLGTGKITTLRDTAVVVEAKSYIKYKGYKSSKLNTVFGGDYDKFATYCETIIDNFQKCNITCYFVALAGGRSGGDIDRRLNIHSLLVDKAKNYHPSRCNLKLDPIFHYDALWEVCRNKGIKVTNCEYNNFYEMLNIARTFDCPVFVDSNNLALSLFGVSCVIINAMTYDSENNCITAKYYDASECVLELGLDLEKRIIFLALLDEEMKFTSNIQHLTDRPKIQNQKVLKWLKRQNIMQIKNYLSQNMTNITYTSFVKHCDKIRFFMSSIDRNSVVLSYSTGTSPMIFNGTKRDNWFQEGLALRRIAHNYVSLYYHGRCSGSWLVYDENRQDAALAAIDILHYVHALLTGKTVSEIDFIGRRGRSVESWQIIKTDIVIEETFGRSVFYNRGWYNLPNYLINFLSGAIPKLRIDLLQKLPDECQILTATLIYYINKNPCFAPVAYSILLCYTIAIAGKQTDSSVKYGLNDYYNLKNVDAIFDRSLIHSLVEFEHCMDQINNLNILCGEPVPRLEVTKFYNATFIYNMMWELQSVSDPMTVIKKLLDCSFAFDHYKQIIFSFNDCLDSLGIQLL